ncbi:MAG: hypothetical protein ACIAQZ_13125 [Sedimentisphaeraceae bacterium JB056]
MRKFRLLTLILMTMALCSASFAEDGGLFLWPRVDKAYLCRNYNMPVWIQIPESFVGTDGNIKLEITMPEGFEVSGLGSSTKFAVQPSPLMVPDEILNEKKDGKTIAVLTMPSSPADQTEDKLHYSKGQAKAYRISVLVNPGESETGSYDITAKLVRNSDGSEVSFSGQFIVLDELASKSPERMRVEAFDYAGYKNPVFKQAIMDAISGSGINVVTNMRVFNSDDTIAQLMKDKGVKPSLILFWHNIIPEIAKKYPEAYPLDKDGNRVTKPDFLLKNNICHTWCINNKDKVKEILKDYFKENVVGKFTAVTNDNEEKALARDGSYIRGDVYTPMTIDAFKDFAGIDSDEVLNPEIIVEKYPQKWVDFRCWQSAQMSSMMSEALFETDPSIEYGYYSGHKYVGNLAGFTKNMYATDWEVLAEQGGIMFGSSGYYGSTDDYSATTKALGYIPHIPAEMYIENFLDFKREMPEPDKFSYRLMNSLMYGSGGFAVWYLQVLDGAAYSAISNVSAIAAEIEDYILDGERCDDQMLLAPTIDKDAVFAYKLGEKRVVVFINHSSKGKTVRYGWKKPIPKPDTVEIVSGKKYADSTTISANIKPKGYAVFVTLSQGN